MLNHLYEYNVHVWKDYLVLPKNIRNVLVPKSNILLKYVTYLHQKMHNLLYRCCAYVPLWFYPYLWTWPVGCEGQSAVSTGYKKARWIPDIYRVYNFPRLFSWTLGNEEYSDHDHQHQFLGEFATLLKKSPEELEDLLYWLVSITSTWSLNVCIYSLMY